MVVGKPKPSERNKVKVKDLLDVIDLDEPIDFMDEMGNVESEVKMGRVLFCECDVLNVGVSCETGNLQIQFKSNIKEV
jgi:hypothetical protein